MRRRRPARAEADPTGDTGRLEAPSPAPNARLAPHSLAALPAQEEENGLGRGNTETQSLRQEETDTTQHPTPGHGSSS